jgi:uncharacterized Tic20 family protein
MPIAVACPVCKAKLKGPEALIGKTVKCPGCGTPVLIQAPAAPAGVAKAPSKKPVPVEDTFEDIDEAPPRKPAKARPKADDFEGLDDITVEPPRKGKAAVKGKGRAADDEIQAIEDLDDIDEDEDYPRKKKGKAAPSGPTNDSERTMAMLLYLSGFLGWIWPLLIWLMKRKESKFIDYHGKQWLNYNITYLLILFLLAVIFVGLGLGLLLGADMWLVGIVVMCAGGFVAFVINGIGFIFYLMAAFKAKGGQWYKMPLVKQFLK